MHRVYQADSLLDTRVGQGCFDLGRQVDKSPTGGGMKGEFLSERLHLVLRESRYSRTTFA